VIGSKEQSGFCWKMSYASIMSKLFGSDRKKFSFVKMTLLVSRFSDIYTESISCY